MKKLPLLLLLSACLISATTLSAPVKSRVASTETDYLSPLPPLPYGAIPVEYIESTGTQYIDTGIVPDSNTGICLDFQVVQYNDGCIGVYQNNPNRVFYINLYSNRLYIRYGAYYSKDGTDTPPIDASMGWQPYGRNQVCLTDGIVKVNGIVFAVGVDVSPLDLITRNFLLFSYHRNSSVTGFCKLRCYGFSMTHGDDDILALIPVRFPNELGEWEGAMYDFVSGELFRNSGTGSFVIGPDL